MSDAGKTVYKEKVGWNWRSFGPVVDFYKPVKRIRVLCFTAYLVGSLSS